MSKMVWHKVGEKLYETGASNGALYVQANDGTYPAGVPWNGLVNVNESPSGAEASPLYADNIKYLNMMSAEEFAATIEAFTYPDEFNQCEGSIEIATGVYAGQQSRKTFGFVYKTLIGNDVNGIDHGYKLHLIYGALAAPSEKAHGTVNDSPEAITFSWEVSTTPVEVPGFKPSASLTFNSTKTDAAKLAALEAILFGSDSAEGRLPLPTEVITLMGGSAITALVLSTIVPADDAATVAVDANIVMTFNNKIHRQSIIVTDNDGTVVAGTITADVTGKILTFNPTTNLDVSTTYIVALAGVTDIYNQTLADTVKNFTTVAS